MKKLLLIVITILFSVSTSLSLEPIKVAYYTTNTSSQSVRAEIKDYSTNSTLFISETNNLTPNDNGIVIVELADHLGANGDLSSVSASSINTNVVVDIYVGGTLFSQQRVDQLLMMQGSTTVFNNSGDFSPPSTSSSLGQDDNREEDAYVGSNTLHVGPDGGMTGGTEMTLSYDEVNNKGVIAIDGATALEAKTTGITMPGLAGGGTQNIQLDNTGKIITGGGGGGADCQR